MNELLGSKPKAPNTQVVSCETWPWVYPTYTLKINKKLSEIESLEIDPSQRMADIDRKNNKVILGDRAPFADQTK
jgi:hypothetical protein